MIVMVIKQPEIIHLSHPLQQLWSGCQGSERGRSSDKKAAGVEDLRPAAVSVRQYNVQLALWSLTAVPLPIASKGTKAFRGCSPQTKHPFFYDHGRTSPSSNSQQQKKKKKKKKKKKRKLGDTSVTR